MTDDFVEFLAEQGRSAVAALHQYRLSFSDKEDQVHVFFEGNEDLLFYMPHVRQRCGRREIYTYICGGKWEIIEARELVSREAYETKTLFFIDRDFDDFFDKQPEAHRGTYVTTDYSIENALVCKAALDIVLIDLARMSRSDPVYRAIVNRWAIEHAEFATAIRPIMAWTLAMRSVAKKPNLNNVDLRRVFQRRDRWRRARKGFAEFVRAACREGEQVPVQSVKHWLKRLSPGREKQWIRGKYELWFFEHFLLQSLSANGSKPKRWTVPAALREHRLFEVLGARVPPPASLPVFLDAHSL